MKIHNLKILPEYFKEVKENRKNFEIRKNDRDFEKGDWLNLHEWDGNKYTGNRIMRKITYILYENPVYGLADGYVILSLRPQTGENNYERLKNMTIDEMAKVIDNLFQNYEAPPNCWSGYGECKCDCERCVKEWLEIKTEPGDYFSIEYQAEE